MNDHTDSSNYQRNALLPAFLAAPILMVAAALVGTDWFTVILFLVSILALIVAWFALEVRHWWWVVIFVTVATLWNPVVPFPFSGIVWVIAQPIVATTFLLAGIFIRKPRSSASPSAR